MKQKLTLAQQFNYKNLEESEKLYKKVTKDILRSIISKVPREMLIEELVRKKIIMKDWIQKGNKYILKEDEN